RQIRIEKYYELNGFNPNAAGRAISQSLLDKILHSTNQTGFSFDSLKGLTYEELDQLMIEGKRILANKAGVQQPDVNRSEKSKPTRSPSSAPSRIDPKKQLGKRMGQSIGKLARKTVAPPPQADLLPDIDAILPPYFDEIINLPEEFPPCDIDGGMSEMAT